MPIHPTAIVDPGAEIDETAEIGPYAIIEGPARIGPGTVIKAHACVTGHTTLGANNILHMGAVVGHEPQHLAYDPATPRYTVVGDNNIFRENVTIHGSFAEDMKTVIGNNCFFMVNSHVAHDSHVHNRVTLANGALLAGHVEVHDSAFISGNCAVHQFTRIGRLVMFEGLSAAGRDVPPFMMVREANQVVGLNIIGLRRAGFDTKTRGEIKTAFRVMYREGNSVPKAMEKLRAGNYGPEVREIIDFVENSKRGVCWGATTE